MVGEIQTAAIALSSSFFFLYIKHLFLKCMPLIFPPRSSTLDMISNGLNPMMVIHWDVPVIHYGRRYSQQFVRMGKPQKVFLTEILTSHFK